MPRFNRSFSKGIYIFPYFFCKRETPKEPLSAFHWGLDKGRYDIVFEVKLTSLTPVAVNPCEDYESSLIPPQYNGEEIEGYYKRWLMVKNRLGISSFTIKGMLESAYANHFGGCYRVVDSLDPHPAEPDPKKYPYGGRYKRYKVDRARSRPGIIRKIEESRDGSRLIHIQPVEEFYYDSPDLGISLQKGQEAYAEVKKRGHINIIKKLSLKKPGGSYKKVYYYGPYMFGMNLTLKGGELGKRHYHRFYSPKGDVLKVTISRLYFMDLEELKSLVYMGKFSPLDKNDPRKDLIDKPWYDDLSGLKEGDWIYYNDLSGNIVGIGRNYQFKAIFDHLDAIPENQLPCSNLEELCPRCSLFGFTKKQEGEGDKRLISYKGRVYTSNFINDLVLYPKKLEVRDHTSGLSFSIMTWTDRDGNEISRQFLLPILGQPKPNKRDVNGYFDNEGYIKGSKIYNNSDITYDSLQEEIDKIIRDAKEWIKRAIKSEKKDYAHQLRTFAQVVKEGLTFRGTVALENASKDEISRMLGLLNWDNFRIGLGRSMGLGRVMCKVSKMWVRKTEDYERWEVYSRDEIDRFIKRETIRPSQLKDLKIRHGRLRYPNPSSKYWKEASNRGA
ncbi:MAG: hypothetical protein DRN95_08710 [Candidatus Hydrothermarchaeota archaeon]|nr:MAG: hypothetical protein DRN95_08710 [Candidatus Hydrothermarchaeota archaeon]